MSDLPRFPYHPDPVATGAFEARTHTCRACERPRAWSYAVAPYATENLRDALCPWCVADGTAAARFDARFTDLSASEVPEGIDPAVLDALTHRTPGFSAWDQERWLFHCGDAAAYLGACGWEELEALPAVRAALVDRAIADGLPREPAEAFVGSLDVDGAATAYLFRCRRCGEHLAYADADTE